MIKPKIGLALGGGGARGFAHIGALKVFEKENLPIDVIVGSSMGAIVGAAYCLNTDVKAIEKNMRKLVNSKCIKKLESTFADEKLKDDDKLILLKKLATQVRDVYLWNLSAIKGCVIEQTEIEEVIENLVDDKIFSDAKINFASLATDLNTAEEVILKSGSLKDALLASSAIPGVFPPAKINNRLLIDGGVINVLPASSAKAIGADIVIGIDVSCQVQPQEYNHGFDIISQAENIRRQALAEIRKKDADILITPDVKKINWASFSKIDSIIKKGKEATEKKLPEIRKRYKKLGIKTAVKNMFSFK
jgi:NTE family protein